MINRRVSFANRVEYPAVVMKKEFAEFLFDASPDAILVADADGRYLDANPAGLRLLGYSLEELRSKRIQDIVLPEEADRAERLHKERLTGPPGRGEWVLQRKDGFRVPTEISSTALPDGRLVAFVRDISARRQAEETLKERNAFIERITELMPTLLYVFDLKTQSNVYVNRQMSSLMGYTWEETLALGPDVLPNLMHPEDLLGLPDHQARCMTAADGEIFNFEYRMRHRNGQWRWLYGRDMVLERDPDGSPRLMIGTAEDVTERKATQTALQQSQERFRAVQDSSVDGFMLLESLRDEAGKIVDFRWEYTNEAAAKIVGRPREWFAGKRLLEEMPGNREDGLYDAYVQVTETGQPYAQEIRYAHEGINVFMRLVAVKVGDGFAVSFADLSDRDRAENALRESEARFRALADNISQFAWMADGSGWIFWYNRRWFDYTGTNLDDMQGWGWRSVHHPDHIERVVEKFTAHVRAGLPWEDTFPLRGADGVYRWFLSRAAPIRNEMGEVTRWFGTNTDVTAQMEAERELRERQIEIEALNQRLRRAMQETHHRVKNNLQVIAALVEMQSAEAAPSATELPLKRINQHIQALAVIHDLLTHQAKGDSDLSTIGAKPVLEKLFSLLRVTIGNRNIQAEVDDIPLTPQQASSLALLVSECISNALKHSKGDIEVTLRREEKAAHLAVCDDGAGFPPDFDPIRAANTGLQLIENAARWDLRGEVFYDNHPGGGGRVTVTFPVIAADVVSAL